MVKTLRITSFLLTAGAICSVLILLLAGLRGKPEIQVILDQEGLIKTLKKQAQLPTQQEDAVSPLVTQAQKFALRIDPPPPPAPPVPAAPREPAQPVAPVAAPPVVSPPQTSGRFTLLATARYEEFPERSLALFRPTTGAAKWHREGETLGHLEIHEIRDGSVVLYQGGQMNTEVFVPRPSTSARPLLRSDAEALGLTLPGHTSGPSLGPASAATGEAPAASPGAIRVPRGTPQTARRTVDVASRVQRVTTTPPPPPREPTPEEQKESIAQSIMSIEKIMDQGGSEGLSAQEQQEEQQAWMQLLDILRQEKNTLDAAGNAEAEPSEEAKD